MNCIQSKYHVAATNTLFATNHHHKILQTHLLALGNSKPPKPNPLLRIQITSLPKHALHPPRSTNKLINGNLPDDFGAMFLLECGETLLLGGKLGRECFLEGGDGACGLGGEVEAGGAAG